MLGEYTLLQFMDDGDGWDFNMNDFTWGEIYYEAGILHYSLDNNLDHNIHKKIGKIRSDYNWIRKI